MVYESEVSKGHMRAGHESQALCLHFTNKLSPLQTDGKAATHFLLFSPPIANTANGRRLSASTPLHLATTVCSRTQPKVG